MLASVKVIDWDTQISGTGILMFTFGDNSKDEDCNGGFHSRELDMCFSSHFCQGKESLEVFREDFKEFFEFGNRVSREGLVGRTEGEATLVPFNVTFPMDMSAEQKCFDLGGACKSAKFFCIKCSTELRKETYFWGKDSGHSCCFLYTSEAANHPHCLHLDTRRTTKKKISSTRGCRRNQTTIKKYFTLTTHQVHDIPIHTSSYI